MSPPGSPEARAPAYGHHVGNAGTNFPWMLCAVQKIIRIIKLTPQTPNLVSEPSREIPEAGAPEHEDEVTPEMIAAGVDVLYERYLDITGGAALPAFQETAALLFRAMDRVRPKA